MKTFLFLFYLTIPSLSLAIAEATKAKKTGDYLNLNTKSSGGGFDSDDIIIEENPDYVPVEYEDFDGSESDDDVSEDEDGDDDAKSKLSKKLKKAKKIPIEPFKLLKKNRRRITIALAVFAFRKEIFMVLLKLLRLRTSKNATTDVLKLLLFVDFMRRMQSGGLFSLGGGDDSSILRTLGAMIDKTMNLNPAYVPPITQHFAFER